MSATKRMGSSPNSQKGANSSGSGRRPSPRDVKLGLVQPAEPVVRKGRKPPPENETARERFLRLGRPRMQNALIAIRLIGNLARSGDYEFNEGDVAAMHDALTQAIDQALSKFRPPVKHEKVFDFLDVKE